MSCVDAEPVSHVVDTTGAGDLFAAGFLFGHVRATNMEQCLRLGGDLRRRSDLALWRAA
ncbi:PfkB family carbohydrate kinase [Novosphingobium colocasiae]